MAASGVPEVASVHVSAPPTGPSSHRIAKDGVPDTPGPAAVTSAAWMGRSQSSRSLTSEPASTEKSRIPRASFTTLPVDRSDRRRHDHDLDLDDRQGRHAQVERIGPGVARKDLVAGSLAQFQQRAAIEQGAGSREQGARAFLPGTLRVAPRSPLPALCFQGRTVAAGPPSRAEISTRGAPAAMYPWSPGPSGRDPAIATSKWTGWSHATCKGLLSDAVKSISLPLTRTASRRVRIRVVLWSKCQPLEEDPHGRRRGNAQQEPDGRGGRSQFRRRAAAGQA